MANLFEIAMQRLLPIEGGYSNDPNDPGNWTGGRKGVGVLKGTKYGIAANTYPSLDIANLTWDQAKAIYRHDFWDQVHADLLPNAVAYSALDGAINSGIMRSTMWLQAAAGVADDGRWGPVTQKAVLAADPNDLVIRYNAARLLFMTNLSTWPTYGRGWARRIVACLNYGAADN
jgi:lysozyme family protein